MAHRDPAEQVYRELKQRGATVRVGMESSGHSRWFERFLRELQFELWGDPAQIRAKRVWKQKTDRQDVQLILQLKTAFHGSGCRTRRIAICGNCYGIVLLSPW